MQTPLLLLACGLVLAAPACRNGAEPVDAASAAETAEGPEDVLTTWECGTLQDEHTLGDIHLAGQPQPEDLALAKERGVRTVFNLRHEAEVTAFDERAVVEELGLEYVHLPWNGPDELTDEVFDRAREVLETAERPILFHCGSANRVGALWLPWRVLDGGKTVEEALEEARTVGLSTPAYEEKAKDYVARRLAAER